MIERPLKERILNCSIDQVFYTTQIQALGMRLVEEKDWGRCLEIHSNMLILLKHRYESQQKKKYLKKQRK